MVFGVRWVVLCIDVVCNRGISRLCNIVNFLLVSFDCVVFYRCFVLNIIVLEIEELLEVSDGSVFMICVGISGRVLLYELLFIGRFFLWKYARVSLRNKRINLLFFSNSEYEFVLVYCILIIKFIICCVRCSSLRDWLFIVVEFVFGVATRFLIKR